MMKAIVSQDLKKAQLTWEETLPKLKIFKIMFGMMCKEVFRICFSIALITQADKN